MSSAENTIVQCASCGNRYPTDALQRDCGNCFACTGCEIYICPACGKAIVVKPMATPKKNK